MLARVRHEAGEALGAIGTCECLAVLADAAADSCVVVAQTCQLALQRIQHFAAAAERSGCADSSGHADSSAVGPVVRPAAGVKARDWRLSGRCIGARDLLPPA